MKREILLIILLVPIIIHPMHSHPGQIKIQNEMSYVEDLPFSSSTQLFMFTNGYAVCNGSLAVINLDQKTWTFDAKKILYLPGLRKIFYINSTGLFSFDLESKIISKYLIATIKDFWFSAGQKMIYAWNDYTLWVIDSNGLLRISYTYDLPIKYVVPYSGDYWLAVVVANSTYSKVYIYSDSTNLKLKYEREKNITSDFIFVDWGGDKAIIYVNTTHLFYWRTYYNTETIIEFPVPLDNIKNFYAIPYWSYSVVVTDDTRVLVRSGNTWYVYTFSGGVSYAKLYIGMRTWSADYPWIIIASDDGLRIIYRDPDTNTWTSQVLYSSPVNSDVYIDDLDQDGIEEFYFVANHKIVRVEIEKIMYKYSYRAVIPSLYFWSGKFILYDRSANDWDMDGLLNDREVNELQTSILRVDTDGDGLTEYFEVYYSHTNPTNNDTDFDGLSDGDEYNIYMTDPNNPDTDNDGLSDGLEIKYNTSPVARDSDGDGLLDGLEVKYNTSPLNSDTDGDGLLDGEEIEYETNPLKNDTDNDRLSDFTEITITHTNPLDADSDNDGLSDYEEYEIYHTDPLKKDTDGDGVPDGAEVSMGFDPNNPQSNPNSIFYVAVAFWWAFLTIFSIGIIFGLLLAQTLKFAKKLWARTSTRRF